MKTYLIEDDECLKSLLDQLASTGQGNSSPTGEMEKLSAVEAIVRTVRERGDAAVAEYTQRFDGVDLHPEQFEMTEEEIDAAIKTVDPALLRALEHAHSNIQRFHARHLRESWEETYEDGTVLGQRISTISKVGVYVPGGKAYYPSSVLMNIVPARVAGVKEIVMVSPPSYNGTIHPVVLAAARLAGATRIFRVAGAQAVAALAYGTEHIPAVLKITGPGNSYVTLAKRLVRGVCDIDTEAGPSEVVVIADEHADPRFVASELLAQAEHDEEAQTIVVTPSVEMAQKVEAEVARQQALLPRNEIISQALNNHGLLIVARTLERGNCRVQLDCAGAFVHSDAKTPRAVFSKIENAGAAMLGAMTPVAVGDYYAGPNHILPTSRRARFASPLTAEDFRKVTSVLYYTKERLQQDSGDIGLLARVEGLTAHANAVEIRL